MTGFFYAPQKERQPEWDDALFYVDAPVCEYYFLYITASTACNVRFTLGRMASISVGA